MQSRNISPNVNQDLLNNIKGISSCYHCQENNIIYDEDRDEIYCFDCGTVLRQGLTDYTPGLGAFPSTDQSNKRKEILEEVKNKGRTA